MHECERIYDADINQLLIMTEILLDGDGAPPGAGALPAGDGRSKDHISVDMSGMSVYILRLLDSNSVERIKKTQLLKWRRSGPNLNAKIIEFYFDFS
ncbi:unnamed protein product [Rhizophagus irregularis]|nr:unnamed protein product [Rhizophagus irregularis]